MTQVITIEKENLKEEVIDDMNNLYKKCKFKKQEDFLELMIWNYKDFVFKLFGKVKGKSHTKFLYKFPDFEKNIYGNISIICLYKDEYYDLDLNLWNEFLNNYNKNISEFELENENEEEELDNDESEETATEKPEQPMESSVPSHIPSWQSTNAAKKEFVSDKVLTEEDPNSGSSESQEKSLKADAVKAEEENGHKRVGRLMLL